MGEADVQASPFLDSLPPEIRLQIYEDVFDDEPPVTLTAMGPEATLGIETPALFLTSHQILRESCPVFYRSSRFLLPLSRFRHPYSDSAPIRRAIDPRYRHYYTHLSSERLSCIRKLQVTGRVPGLNWGLSEVVLDIDIAYPKPIFQIFEQQRDGTLLPYLSKGYEWEPVMMEQLSAVLRSIPAGPLSAHAGFGVGDLLKIEEALNCNS